MALLMDEVAAGVHVVKASHTNFVLIVEDQDVLLVDAGYPRDRSLITAALVALGHAYSDLAAIVLTHAHVDHRGDAEWIRRNHGVPVLCHTDERAHAVGETKQQISEIDLALRLWRPRVLAFTWNALSKGGATAAAVRQVGTFGDDETLDLPGHPVVVHTPGHTSGHVALHLPDRGVLISGDALITVDVWNQSEQGPQLIRPQFAWDHDRAVASLDRLEPLAADTIVVGHGQPFRGSPAEAVKQARRRLG